GGAAKAAIKVLLDLGIFDITIVSRGKQNFHSHYTISYEYFTETKQSCDILINCTPVGMYPNVKESPIPKELINTKVVIDLIYNPKETQLLKFAKALGCTAINGQLMLEKQAEESQHIWTAAQCSL
ncbi:MAG: shikimate dehydrogenase, partial [Anaerovorax sp.]